MKILEYYRFDTMLLEIVRVLHARRGVRRLLEE
jgi:plasmid stabilization system protein ParE